MKKPRIPLQERYALAPAEAAQYVGVDRSTFYRRIMPHVRGRAIQSLRIGARLLIVRVSLDAWLARQSGGEAA